MPIKKLGQNFLRNPQITKHLVELADISKQDVVLEIGPGKGIITEELIKKAGKVIAIEKDRELSKTLQRNLPEVRLISGDALKVKWPDFNKCISALPFNISSPVTFKLFSYKWEKAVLVYQKEFAQRFLAEPGKKNYSRLTVAVNYYSKPEILGIIPKTEFYPQPKVDAAIVRLTPKKPEFPTTPEFWKFVREIFRYKRKTVGTGLRIIGFSKDRIEMFDNSLLKKRVNELDLLDLKRVFGARFRN